MRLRVAPTAVRLVGDVVIDSVLMSSEDPDAIWRPGFRGEITYPRRDDGQPARRQPFAPAPSRDDASADVEPPGVTAATPPPTSVPVRRSRRGRFLACGVVTTIVAVVAFTGVGSSDSLRAPQLPSSPRQQWAVTVVGELNRSANVLATDDTVVVPLDRAPFLVAFDVHSGAERWRADTITAPVVSLHALNGAAVAITGTGRDVSMTVYDLDDGSMRWTRPINAPGAGPVITADLIGIATDDTDGPTSTTTLEVFDTGSGETTAAVTGDSIQVRDDSVIVRRGRALQLLDPVTLEPLADPLNVDALAALEPDVTLEALATDAGVLLATVDTATLINNMGTTISTVQLAPAQPGDVGYLRLTAVSDTQSMLVTPHSVTLLATNHGALEALWGGPGLLAGTHFDNNHQLVALFEPPASPGAGQGIALTVIDTTNDRAVWAGTMPIGLLQRNVLTATGFLAGTPTAPADTPDPPAVAYDLEGRSMWALPIADAADTIVLHDAIITATVHPLTDATTISRYS
jgi:hypothetical protein